LVGIGIEEQGQAGAGIDEEFEGLRVIGGNGGAGGDMGFVLIDEEGDSGEVFTGSFKGGRIKE